MPTALPPAPVASTVPTPSTRMLNAAVVVAALGYFVDLYDLILFGIVRVPSLRDIGVPEGALLEQGARLLNWQMTGMLLGGIAWGILGDRRGRVSILFGSIVLYSVANLLNAYADSLAQFTVLRFVAGVGLAGELGAGITLVAESLPTGKRGGSAAVVAGFGVLGAVAANLVAERYQWRAAYLIGGVMGLALLAVRAVAFESGLFRKMAAATAAGETVRRGDFLGIFRRADRLGRYACCIGIGLPLWFMVGILMFFAPEFARTLGVAGTVTAGRAVMWCYLGLALGDFASGFLSQAVGSRRGVVLGFTLALAAGVGVYLFGLRGVGVGTFYTACGLLGFAGGYWAVLLVMAAEQFGTNLRATVTTTVPNFIRGAVPAITTVFLFAKEPQRLGLIGGAAGTGLFCFALAWWSLSRLKETCGRELDFYERD